MKGSYSSGLRPIDVDEMHVSTVSSFASTNLRPDARFPVAWRRILRALPFKGFGRRSIRLPALWIWHRWKRSGHRKCRKRPYFEAFTAVFTAFSTAATVIRFMGDCVRIPGGSQSTIRPLRSYAGRSSDADGGGR